MIGILAAGAMVASFFMPWLDFFGNTAGPTVLLGENGPPLAELPWRYWAFLASFALAAVAMIQALAARQAGLLMLSAGAIPFALSAEKAFGTSAKIEDLGLPLPDIGNPSEVINVLTEVTAIGLPAYFISAAVLVIVGLARLLSGR